MEWTYDISIYCSILITGVIAIVLGKLFWRNRHRPRAEPRDVVILHQLGRGPNAPSISPFPLKLETYLRMANIPYKNDHSVKFSSKGKTPWVEYNGTAVADSQFCIEHFANELNIDVNEHLTPQDRAIARAFQKMAEENLYWSMCAVTFGSDTEPLRKVLPYKGVTFWVMTKILSYKIQQQMWYHGIGRHTAEEIWSIGSRDMKALSIHLGNKKFFMGDEPSEVDCAIFGIVAQIRWHMEGSPHETLLKDECDNLVQYCESMKNRFWPDWNDRIRSSNSYKDDSDSVYRDMLSSPSECNSNHHANGTILMSKIE